MLMHLSTYSSPFLRNLRILSRQSAIAVHRVASINRGGSKSVFQRSFSSCPYSGSHAAPLPLNGIGQDRGNLSLPVFVFTLGFHSKEIASTAFFSSLYPAPSGYAVV
jgi:hypothetical protein